MMPLGHNAEAQLWAGEHRAGCNNCGWVGRVKDSEEKAAKAAARHNKDATARDHETFLLLWGPRRTQL